MNHCPKKNCRFKVCAMKIFKNGELIADMPAKPKNLDCGSKGGIVSVVVANAEIVLAKYASQERGCEVMKAICKAYLADAEEYHLPKE